MTLAPILLFTYKRLDTLKETVLALQKNYLAAESDLIIFSDAAKTESDSEIVDSVRDYIKTIGGFKSITIFEATENKGLAKSIISGVSKVIKDSKKVIVVEDDLITTSNFLDYMNQGLDHYKNEYKVFSICGFSFDLRIENYEFDTYFLNRGWPWTWATWEDRWDQIDWNVNDYHDFIKDRNRKKEFAKLGSDVVAMLRKQMEGKLDSWAIRWTYHQFKNNTISLFPSKSLVFNAGFDEFATHTKGSKNRYLPTIDSGLKRKFSFLENAKITCEFQRSFNKKMGYLSRIKTKLETFRDRILRR